MDFTQVWEGCSAPFANAPSQAGCHDSGKGVSDPVEVALYLGESEDPP